MPDPLGTAALRAAVLDAWRASPSRFREDANAEEDLLRGGYRDRWFVELAQNAADAAERAGTPTRLSVTVAAAAGGPELRVGARGAPLDAAGVAALASLRASAKRDDGGVGRFGVGFAAVTAISDAPRVVSTSGAVGFDRARTARAVADAASAPPPREELAAELARREGAVPVLRLVWPVDETPPEGCDTEVRLPLRDDLDADALLAVARDQAPDVLLALPWLTGVDVGDGKGAVDREGDSGRVVLGGRARWVVRTGGELPAALVVDLAVEDRARTTWRAAWAFPLDEDRAGDVPVLGAPTPTDERLTLPARLVADVPLDPDRRHVRAGPVTEHVLRAAAAAYPALAAGLAPERRLDLVPRTGLPASAVDATLRDAVLDSLRTAPWLPGADGAPRRPDRAVALGPALDDPELPALLTDVVGDLVALGHDTSAGPALAALGVPRLGPADLAEGLAGVRPSSTGVGSPAWWRALYAVLARCAGGTLREELAGLPVPLADGRTVVGPRGTLLPDTATDATDPVATDPIATVDVPGLRLVHPDAAHPLLVRLGAEETDAAALLAAPALREAVDRALDDADSGLDTAPLAALVLGLVARGGSGEAGRELGGLALPDTAGDVRRADELVLPDGAVRPLLGADSPLGVLHPDVAAAHPREALVAVGVLDGFAVLRDDAPAGPDHDLDDEETWWVEEVEPADPDASPGTGEAGPMLAVRDLELVDDWPAAWPVLAGDRAVREALTVRAGGPRPYTSWWLAHHARLGGRRPDAWRLPSASALGALYDPVPSELDEAFLAAVGVRAALAVTGPGDAADLLTRLGDPDRPVDAATAAAAHAALAAAARDGVVEVADVDPPARVRTLDGVARPADPERSAPPVVLDRPWLLDVLPPAQLVAAGDAAGDAAGAAALADLLDLGLASSRVHGLVRSQGEPTSWRALPEVVAWAGSRGWSVPEGEVVRHRRLLVLVTDDEQPDGGPVEHRPRLWVDDRGTLHTDDPVRALMHVGSQGGP